MLRARREMAMEIWRSALARKPTRDASRTARSASFFYPRVSRGETVHLHDPSLCCAGLGLLFGLGRHTVKYIYTHRPYYQTHQNANPNAETVYVI